MWYPYCEDDYERGNNAHENDRMAKLENSISNFLSGQSDEVLERFLPDFGREYYSVTIKRVTVIE